MTSFPSITKSAVPSFVCLLRSRPVPFSRDVIYDFPLLSHTGNGAQPYYPNDYQVHPSATVQGRRAGPPMPMPGGYDQMDYPVDDRLGVIRVNGQQGFDPRQPDMYQQGYPVYDQQQVMYQRNGLEQHPGVYQNEVLDYRQIPGGQMTNLQGIFL